MSNPLEIDTGDVRDGLNLIFRQIQFLKRFIKSADTKTIEILKQDLKNFFTNEWQRQKTTEFESFVELILNGPVLIILSLLWFVYFDWRQTIAINEQNDSLQ